MGISYWYCERTSCKVYIAKILKTKYKMVDKQNRKIPSPLCTNSPFYCCPSANVLTLLRLLAVCSFALMITAIWCIIWLVTAS